MRSFFTLAVTLSLLVAALAAAPVQAASSSSTMLRGELLVRLRPGYSLSMVDRSLVAYGPDSGRLELGRQLSQLDVYAAQPIGSGSGSYRIQLSTSIDPRVAAAPLSTMSGVVYAEPNYTRTVRRTPNDSVVHQQWGLTNVQAFEAWDITTGGPLVIAVVDTGVDAGHADLSGKVLPGYNAFANNGNASDDNGHGTAVAGLIAASTDNGAGVAGICWGCQILPVKVLNSDGAGSDASVSAGIRWAADNGARVINLSLGGNEDSQTLHEAVDYAISKGILVVAASGNEQQEGNPTSYPAAYDNVLAVGATGNTDVVTGFSNTGDYVDLAAPGVGLWTTLPDNQYGPPNGTSFSSPYVARAAGLVLTLRPDLGWYDTSCILMASSDDKGAAGKDSAYGYGRLNVFKAVQLAQSYSGCPLAAPAPQPQPQPAPQPDPAPAPAPQPPSTGTPPAFAPIAPVASSADRAYFAETGHSLNGEFKRYWERHGGLAIFGYPTSEEFVETGSDGKPYTVQYFERHRFEFHPENAAPYNVLLSRIGDDILHLRGRDWFSFPKTGPQAGCRYFEQTGQSICEPFLSYWRSNGLEFDGKPGKSFNENLALFGQPISPPQVEEIAPGVFIIVQWFERARLEDHGAGRVLLGLLGNELTQARGWR